MKESVIEDLVLAFVLQKPDSVEAYSGQRPLSVNYFLEKAFKCLIGSSYASSLD